MKLLITSTQKQRIAEGDIRALAEAINATYEREINYLIYHKEDAQLFQGRTQALLAIKEVLPKLRVS